MPIEIKAYACEYCSRPALRSKNAMKQHEMVCWKNRATKSCPTCAHQCTKSQPGGMIGDDIYEESRHICHLGIREFGALPISNCKHWELK